MKEINCKNIEFNNNQVPIDLKFHTAIAVRAMAFYRAGGWRIWMVCRKLDYRGAGWVKEAQVREYLKNHDVSLQKITRWLSDAIEKDPEDNSVEKGGFVKQQIDSVGKNIFRYKSEARVAEMLGCVHVDTHYTAISPNDLFGKKWRASIWSKYVFMNHNNKIISQQKIMELTGIERHRQTELNKAAKIFLIRNIERTNSDASRLKDFREFGKSNTFVNDGKVIVRLPDCRIAPQTEILARGRTKKINGELNNNLYENLKNEVERGSKSMSENELKCENGCSSVAGAGHPRKMFHFRINNAIRQQRENRKDSIKGIERQEDESLYIYSRAIQTRFTKGKKKGAKMYTREWTKLPDPDTVN